MRALDNLPDQPPTRQMFRNKATGQLGYLVERHGREMIRLDRPAEEILAPFSPDLWTAEASERPINRAQVARVAFEADRALCRVLGDHATARKPWESLKDEERIEWITDGPPAGDARRRALYEAVVTLFPDAR